MKIQTVELRFSNQWPGKASVSNDWKNFEAASWVVLRVKEYFRPKVI